MKVYLGFASSANNFYICIFIFCMLVHILMLAISVYYDKPFLYAII